MKVFLLFTLILSALANTTSITTTHTNTVSKSLTATASHTHSLSTTATDTHTGTGSHSQSPTYTISRTPSYTATVSKGISNSKTSTASFSSSLSNTKTDTPIASISSSSVIVQGQQSQAPVQAPDNMLVVWVAIGSIMGTMLIVAGIAMYVLSNSRKKQLHYTPTVMTLNPIQNVNPLKM